MLLFVFQLWPVDWGGLLSWVIQSVERVGEVFGWVVVAVIILFFFIAQVIRIRRHLKK